MSKTISEIYSEYKIIPSLQEHMLRVTAVAIIICDNFTEPIPKEDIIKACLLHDMGNIIKFKMDVMPEFFQPEGVEYWQKVKDEFIEKYGDNEHKATVKIMEELDISKDIITIADQNRFSLLCSHQDSDNYSVKILHYADGRVNPFGVVSYEDRMEDARRRYVNHKNKVEEDQRKKLVDCGKEIEKQIFSKCKIKPEDITNEVVAPIIEELRNFMLK